MTIEGGSPPHHHDMEQNSTNTHELTQVPLSVQIYLVVSVPDMVDALGEVIREHYIVLQCGINEITS